MGGYSTHTESDIVDGLAYSADPTGQAGLSISESPGGDNPYTTPYGITYAADEWQGWEQEIAAHSAGLEMYTAPTEPGQPGITELTDAGKAALGYSTGERVIMTYSYGAATGSKPQELNLLASWVQQQIQPLINAALAPLITQMADLKAALTGSLDEIWQYVMRQVQGVAIAAITAYKELRGYFDAAVGTVNAALQQTYKTVQGWISAAVNAAQGALQQAVTLVQSALQAADAAIRASIDALQTWTIQQVQNLNGEVQKLWAMLQDIVQKAQEEAVKTAQAIADLNDSLQAWVEDHVIEILLRALDAAVVPL